MAIIYRWARYHVANEEEMESIERAIGQAKHDVEYNEACPIEIREDDKVLMDYDAILEIINSIELPRFAQTSAAFPAPISE